ncbi:MAG: peptide deformylase [Rhodocyclaceae bacterium]
MIRPVLRMGDARLLRVARPVVEFDSRLLRELLDDLFDTMRARDGAGLAAPQIGIDLRVVVFGFEHNARYPEAEPVPVTVLINPVIEALGEDEEGGWEGCLCVPGMRGWVPRLRRIRYRGFDEAGRAFEREASGFHARLVQHECDHLDGILYPMRMRDLARFGFTDVLFPEGGSG